MTTPAWLARLRRSERGAALATVALLGGAIIMLGAVIVARATFSYGAGNTDRSWEEAIHIAESGVDSVLYDLSEANPVLEYTGPLDSRDEVIVAAESLVTTDVDNVEATPDGDVVTFKDANDDVIYSVGFSPSYDDTNKRVRVIATEFDAVAQPALIPNWTANYALLAGGDVTITGAARVNGAGANVHTNGSLNTSWTKIEGCGSESVDSGYAPGPGCPLGPRPPQPIPIVDTTAAYSLSWFDMCPDGQAHAGPAHPTLGGTNSGLCTGDLIPGRQGMNPTGSGWANNNKNTPPGVYYVVGDFDGRIGFRNDLPVTIIAAKPGGAMDCSTPGGSIWVSSQSSAVGHPTAGGLTMVAAEDIVFRGGADIIGLVLAHEQIDYKGNSSLTGAVIAEHACNTPSSPISGATVLSGTADIYWNGPISTPFQATDPTGGGPPVITVVGSREV